MDEENPPPRDLRNLAWILIQSFARSFVFTLVRVLAMGWFIYFGLRFSAHVEGGYGLLYLIMFPLSIFGLWQVLELLGKITGLKIKDSKADESE